MRKKTGCVLNEQVTQDIRKDRRRAMLSGNEADGDSIVFLLTCLICLPALITIACDRTVDRPVPSCVLNHRGSGVAVVGTTRLPIGCPPTKGLSSSPRRR